MMGWERPSRRSRMRALRERNDGGERLPARLRGRRGRVALDAARRSSAVPAPSLVDGADEIINHQMQVPLDRGDRPHDVVRFPHEPRVRPRAGPDAGHMPGLRHTDDPEAYGAGADRRVVATDRACDRGDLPERLPREGARRAVASPPPCCWTTADTDAGPSLHAAPRQTESSTHEATSETPARPPARTGLPGTYSGEWSFVTRTVVSGLTALTGRRMTPILRAEG